MISKVLSAHVQGIEATPVLVETDVSNIGLPSFSIVGLAEGAVRESRDRVRSALRNIDFNLFSKPITVNLAPADIKKDGSHYDLPIAVGLIAAVTDIAGGLENALIAGELSLDGSIRGITGALCISMWAKDNGITKLIIPKENAEEAALVEGLDIYPFDRLSEVIAFLKGEGSFLPYASKITEYQSKSYEQDFSYIKGQFAARRAAEVAAAGMHNIVMIGSPGSGKTMIAKSMLSIMPPMTKDEALLTTKVHSVAGLLKDRGSLITERPFIAPHHTASNVAIIGGGARAMPGNVSIATNGILFLDEMLEFNRSVLEVLRQPLEDGVVTVARAGRTVTYPASFMLVAACNPCPCGYSGDSRWECKCSPVAIERYRSRLSGPLLDRIDLHVQMVGVDFKDLQNAKAGESSEKIRERVIAAQEMQKERFKKSDIHFNSQMTEALLKKYANLDKGAQKIIAMAMDRFAFSARAYGKILKTARTIADLNSSENVLTEHVAEALQYRMLDK